MNLLLASEHRFLRTPAGEIHSRGGLGRVFWERYLDVFERVTVLARIQECDDLPQHAQRSDGDRVRFWPLPGYFGPWRYLLARGRLLRTVRRSVAQSEAILLRVPGIIGSAVGREVRGLDRPFALEVLGDPWEVFSPRTARFVGRSVVRRIQTSQLRVQCAGAAAVSYVTRTTLQSRYPPDAAAHVTHCSSVELRRQDFIHEPRTFTSCVGRLIAIGSFGFDYKGFAILLGALANEPRSQRPRLTLVGGGRLLERYRRMATELGVDDAVRFTGPLPAGGAVRAELDKADLFVMPSLTEGLPRAMIEAMARGLPCIGSRVGGIPELLPPEDMFAADNVDALASKLKEVASDCARLTRMSARNLAEAAKYEADMLAERRRAFYTALRNRTETWLERSSGP